MSPENQGLFHTPLGQKSSPLGRVVCRLGCLCAGLIGLFVVGQNLFALAAEPLRLVGVLGLMAVLTAGVWSLARLPRERRWDAALLGVCLGLCLALRLGWMLVVRTPVQSDFGLMLDAARQAAAGDFSWTGPEGSYFWRWSYQIPFVLYEALVWKLIPSLWALKGMNLLFMVGIDALIYAIARRFLPARAALVTALLYAVYPASIHMSAVLTNQHIATFFLLLGVWLVLTGKGWPQMLLAGACFAIENLMRSEAIVFLATLLCCALCLFLRFPRRETAKRLAAGVLAVLVAYAGVSRAVGAGLTAAGAAPYGVTNRMPQWLFVLGLDAAGNGGYSERNAHVLTILDDGARAAETRRIIDQSFRQRGDAVGFFAEKTAFMWAQEESFYWSTGYLDPAAKPMGISVDAALKLLSTAEKALYLLAWSSMPLAAWILFLGKEEDWAGGGAFFCLIAVCAAFCAYLLIEVQPRYRYFIMPFLFLLSGLPAWRLQALGRKSEGRSAVR